MLLELLSALLPPSFPISLQAVLAMHSLHKPHAALLPRRSLQDLLRLFLPHLQQGLLRRPARRRPLFKPGLLLPRRDVWGRPVLRRGRGRPGLHAPEAAVLSLPQRQRQRMRLRPGLLLLHLSGVRQTKQRRPGSHATLPGRIQCLLRGRAVLHF